MGKNLKQLTKDGTRMKSRSGCVKGRSQLINKKNGISMVRDTSTGKFVYGGKEGAYKGIKTEKPKPVKTKPKKTTKV